MGMSLISFLLKLNPDPRIAKILIESGARVDADATLTVAILEAARHLFKENSNTENPTSRKILDTMEFLLDNGADINKRGIGDTPLHLALRLKELSIIRILLHYNPDVLERMTDQRHIDITDDNSIQSRIDQYGFNSFHSFPETQLYGPTPLEYCEIRGISNDIVRAIKERESQQCSNSLTAPDT